MNCYTKLSIYIQIAEETTETMSCVHHFHADATLLLTFLTAFTGPVLLQAEAVLASSTLYF